MNLWYRNDGKCVRACVYILWPFENWNNPITILLNIYTNAFAALNFTSPQIPFEYFSGIPKAPIINDIIGQR